jgi:hypothetical protein
MFWKAKTVKTKQRIPPTDHTKSMTLWQFTKESPVRLESPRLPHYSNTLQWTQQNGKDSHSDQWQNNS